VDAASGRLDRWHGDPRWQVDRLGDNRPPFRGGGPHAAVPRKARPRRSGRHAAEDRAAAVPAYHRGRARGVRTGVRQACPPVGTHLLPGRSRAPVARSRGGRRAHLPPNLHLGEAGRDAAVLGRPAGDGIRDAGGATRARTLDMERGRAARRVPREQGRRPARRTPDAEAAGADGEVGRAVHRPRRNHPRPLLWQRHDRRSCHPPGPSVHRLGARPQVPRCRHEAAERGAGAAADVRPPSSRNAEGDDFDRDHNQPRRRA